MTTIYLGSVLQRTSSDSPFPFKLLHSKEIGAVLHGGKDFAVSPRLRGLVSVRTSGYYPDGYYPLPG